MIQQIIGMQHLFMIYKIQPMFQNSFQNGTFFDILDPKTPADKTKHLFKISHMHTNPKIFDKDLKTYIYEFNSPSAQISLPGDDKRQLYLIQQYLNIHIFFFPNMPWTIELYLSDQNKIKRRVNFSHIAHRVERKNFFVKYPCEKVKGGIWGNFVVDLFSFMDAFKGENYRSLDAIHISGHFKLRRIFTTNSFEESYESKLEEGKTINFLPKNFFFPQNVHHTTFEIKYEEEIMEEINECSEVKVKNNHQINKRKEKVTSKVENYSSKDLIGRNNQKNFLANTNGVIRRRKQEFESSTEKSDFNQTKMKTPLTDKNLTKKKSLNKTQNPKSRLSIEKKKQETKEKMNPWRSTQKQVIKPTKNVNKSQNQKNRKIQSSKTAEIKNKHLPPKNKNASQKSDHYSDSEYFELSQKFSTISDGKLFKINSNSPSPYVNSFSEHKNNNNNNIEDEIQENIEMESMMSNSLKKNNQIEEVESKVFGGKKVEEMSDSLDKLVNGNMKKSKNLQKMESQMMTSHYGFGEKVVKKFMEEVERPYSPPLGERQITEQHYTEKQDDDKEMQLIYDPVLNCYYDHKTHTYYELKN